MVGWMERWGDIEKPSNDIQRTTDKRVSNVYCCTGLEDDVMFSTRFPLPISYGCWHCCCCGTSFASCRCCKNIFTFACLMFDSLGNKRETWTIFICEHTSNIMSITGSTRLKWRWSGGGGRPLRLRRRWDELPNKCFYFSCCSSSPLSSHRRVDF